MERGTGMTIVRHADEKANESQEPARVKAVLGRFMYALP